ncbi:MAG: hypothetical protein M1823_001761 [Watsoniomyces obsoletus]|nr:MAG: hypothetical protein M1823_001761 [Watsoniomyces obsoletus]
MFRMGSWLTPKPTKPSSTHSLDHLNEHQYLEDVLRAATQIINDDIEGAEEGLNQGNSSFHKLGRGIILFIKATLGFEQDVMREALNAVNDAETTAGNDLRRAQQDGLGSRSSIYPPGSEFALCQAESQLMCAVVALLNENLTESLKGFYKLRKAYMTLSAIVDVEAKFVKSRSQTSLGGKSKSSVASHVDEHGQSVTKSKLNQEVSNGDREDDEDAFYDANDVSSDPTPNGIEPPQSEQPAVMVQGIEDLKLAPVNGESKVTDSQHLVPTAPHDEIGNELLGNPIDTFIHSGSNLCFGLLLVMISMIPPTFGKLLAIIGFKGDRGRGLKMLWLATKSGTVNGAMAGLILLGFYNGIFNFCDILPADDEPEDVEGYPKQRCEVLLKDMREQYPQSHLWLVEEARMLAANCQLEDAIDLLSKKKQSQLRQLDALATFERSMNSMYLHRHEDTCKYFLECVRLNSWSHALYFYIAGVSQVELYRIHKQSDPDKAQHHAKLAEEYLLKLPALTGIRRFMARQLPFDVFVLRKVKKWQHRAKEGGLKLLDAVGVSPIEEMIYIWNGYKRMQPTQLRDSLKNLHSWSSPETNPNWTHETLDEKAVHALLCAATLRSLGEYSQAEDLLQEHILRHDRQLFKGPLKEDWAAPSAHYEMAVLCWLQSQEKDGGGGGDGGDGSGIGKGRRKDKLKECGEWLEKAARWESFELDSRYVFID